MLLDEWGIADELQGIAQALLGEQQDGLALEARAIPERLTKRGRRKAPVLPAPLVFGPPAFEITPKEPDLGQIQMRRGVVRFEAHGLLVAGHCLRQLSLLRKRPSKVAMRFGIVRFEAQGLLVAGYRLRQPSLLRKRHSKVAMRIGIVRFEAQG